MFFKKALFCLQILAANEADLTNARNSGVRGALYDRLILTPNKLESLCAGLLQIADSSHTTVGRVVRRTQGWNS
jgi:gamma-glutamyl phosphate reductase